MSARRVIFTLDSERDRDIVAWLATQPSKSAAIRAVLRGVLSPAPILDTAALRRVVREELARVAVVGQREAFPTADADPDAAVRLDAMF
jgi:hypothetical protein